MQKMSSVESILEALIVKGWCFKDAQQIHALLIHSTSLDSIHSELLNMDLRDFGGKSLPDPSSLKKSSYLQGPKILQVVSVRDIYQSTIDAPFGNSQHRRRLLRFCLTDGCSEVPAIEYSPIPLIAEEIVPGTKICLENKVTVRNSILCLDSKTVTVLGGIVQSLYEEWQMKQKFSGFSRSSLMLSQNSNDVGPPPFEKLQIEKHPDQQHTTYNPSKSTSNDMVSTLGRPRISNDKQMGTNRVQHNAQEVRENDSRANKRGNDPKLASITGRTEDKPSSSQSRPKEVPEATPVQNQAAAQKLLQRMSDLTHGERPSRGSKYRGKGKQEEHEVFTLDEWERRKGGGKPAGGGFQDVSRDEELAWQLQNQLDLEDCHVKVGHESEAEQLRMSMFNFGNVEGNTHDGQREFRGRGRGRGRGGGGGGGRGRGSRRVG